MAESLKECKERITDAWQRKRYYERQLREIYQYIMPYRDPAGSRVLDAALRGLKSDKRIFGLLEREARRISESGNVLDREGNAARAQDAGQLGELIEKLATTRGTVATLLNDAAIAVSRGLAPAQASRAFVRRIGDILDKEGINGLLKAEPSVAAEAAPSRIDEPNGAEAKAQLEALEQNADQGVMFALRAYHGTRHDFERFDLGKIGTGEGEQVYGHGLYFAENESVAGHYRDVLGGINLTVDGKPFLRNGKRVGTTGSEVVDSALISWDGDISGAIRSERRMRQQVEEFSWTTPETLAKYDRTIAELQAFKGEVKKSPGGNLYEVDIDVEPEHLLDLDRPLAEQGDAVKSAIRAVGIDPEEINTGQYPNFDNGPITGRLAYALLHDRLGYTQEAASAALREAGIPGLRYFDAGSRGGAQEASRNIVIFDDSLVRITAKNGMPVTGAERQGLIDQMFALRAFHGSPHDFDRFDLNKLGTGEGAQVFGHGLYFAENKAVADQYRDALSPGQVRIDGKTESDLELVSLAEAKLKGLLPDRETRGREWVEEARAALDEPPTRVEKDSPLAGIMEHLPDDRQRDLQVAEEYLAKVERVKAANVTPGGSLYEVDIDVEPHQLLDWDARIADQSPGIKSAIAKLFPHGLVEPEIRAVDGGFQIFVDGAPIRVPYGRRIDAEKRVQAGVRTSPTEEVGQLTGRRVYDALMETRTRVGGSKTDPALQYPVEWKDPESSSRILREAGIPGIRYLDQGSRGAAGKGTRNIVIFDDSLVKITAKNGEPVTGAERQGLIDQMFSLSAKRRTNVVAPWDGKATLTGRYAGEAANVRADIDRAMSKMLPLSWRHEARNVLVYGGREVEGFADPYERIVYVSMAALDPLERAYEEAGHALKAAKLIPEADYEVLRAEAKRLGAREHFDIDGRYGEIYGQRSQGAALEARLEEEAIMQMIAAHARGRTAPGFEPASLAKRVLDRISKFLRAVQDALGLRGFRSYEDVFEDLTSGRLSRQGVASPPPELPLHLRAANQNIPTPPRGPFSDASFADLEQMARNAGVDAPISGWEDWGFEVLDNLTTRRLRALPETEKLTRLDQAMRQAAAAGFHLEALPDDMRVARFMAGQWLPAGGIANRALETVQALFVDAKGNRTIPVAEFNRRFNDIWATHWDAELENARSLARMREVMFATGEGEDQGTSTPQPAAGAAAPGPQPAAQANPAAQPGAQPGESTAGGRPRGNVRDLINGALAEGRLTREDADAMLTRFAELERHYAANPPQAAEQLAEEIDFEALLRRRQRLLGEQRRQQIESYILDFRDERGQPDPARAMIAMLDHHGVAALPAGLSSTVGRERAILGTSMARMTDMLAEFTRSHLTGRTRNRARLENVVRELFGENTGDAEAREFGRIWSEVAEDLRQRYNAAGGAIGRLESWGLPQAHDRIALLKRGMERWIGDITPLLDPARMRNPLTGNAMTAEELRRSLVWIYREITSDGWHEREASMLRPGLGAVANQRGAHRFLTFRNADAWLRYQADYGAGGNPFVTMMSHLRGMARDIADMEVLGPNPRGMLTYMQEMVQKQAAQRAAGLPALFPEVTRVTGRRMAGEGNWATVKNAQDYGRSMIELSENMYNIRRGHAGAAVNSRVAAVFDVMRNLNVGNQLGGAFLSAATDAGFQRSARAFAGLSQTRILGDIVRENFSSESRFDAVRAGLILDSALDTLKDNARFFGGMNGPAWSRVIADRTLNWSLLQTWTQAGRHAWGKAVMLEFADNVSRTFAELPERLRSFLQRYGLEATDWDGLRLGADGLPREGLDYLTPMGVWEERQGAGLNDTLHERYLELILQESEYAVPMGTLEAQARSYGSLRRGVVIDEVRRSAMQYKMFGLTVAMLQSQRIVAETLMRGVVTGATIAAGLVIGTTLLGSLSIQLKELSRGKDARPMDNTKFWLAAFLQGGGAGIFGDFLFAEQNRFGGGLAETVAGPTVGNVAQALRLTAGNLQRGAKGEKTNFSREAVQFLGRNTPGSSLWYLRLGYERILLDQLQGLLDPEAKAAWRRRVQMQKRDYGNDFYWQPGELAPQRAPALMSR